MRIAKQKPIIKDNISSKDLKKILPSIGLKVRKKLLGSNDKAGWIIQLITYILLISIGFIYIYPIIHMVSTSFKSLDDLLNPSIKWLPSSLYFENYRRAFITLDIKNTLFGSIVISLVPTFFQVIVTGLVGYGFAHFNFRFKNIFLFFMIFSFIIPPQILMMPTYVLFNDLGMLGSLSAFIIPAMLGQGIKSAIFILIFYQFFRQTPVSLYEAAEVDGASEWTCFWKIAVPMAVPAIIIVFLFSFVWYWNETYLVNLYIRGGTTGSNWNTLLTQLQGFGSNYSQAVSTMNVGDLATNQVNEGITMAGTMITLIPLLITYLFLQKYFVESVDKSGITGE